MEMKRLFNRKAAAVLLGLIPVLASAQEQPGTISYSLPSTTITLEVTAVRELFYAGPYAAYAKKYLGIEAGQTDASKTVIESITMTPSVEADLSKRHSAPAGAAEKLLTLSSLGLVSLGPNVSSDAVIWRFPSIAKAPDYRTRAVTSPYGTEIRTVYKDVQTDTAVVRIAEKQTVSVEKSLEAKAKEAADMVLKARRERFNITIGNTDATFSGEALGAAIKELDRTEQEYLSMFVGTTVRDRQVIKVDVVPVFSDKTRSYLAFRVSDQDGVSSDPESTGKPYYLEITPEPLSEADASEARPVKGGQYLHYRIPAVCIVILSDGDDELMSSRIPIYQMGKESTLPVPAK